MIRRAYGVFQWAVVTTFFAVVIGCSSNSTEEPDGWMPLEDSIQEVLEDIDQGTDVSSVGDVIAADGTLPTDDICSPQCDGLVCGPDPLCGVSCGDCGEGEECSDDGQCICAKDCTGLGCGPDPLCGLSCGDCGPGDVCNLLGACVDEGCHPNCRERSCGPDLRCGFSCGECETYTVCDDRGQCIWVPDEYTVDCTDGMCLVPAGFFGQGCNEIFDTNCENNEKPFHEVFVPAFEIDQFEATMAEYGNCVSRQECDEPELSYDERCNWNKSVRSFFPINCITWWQAKKYCQAQGKRLCSESEWEKAARGTDGRTYPWGNQEPSCEYTVMRGADGEDGCGTGLTMPVGSKPADVSPYGVYDMGGNVGEWLEDDWHGTYDGAPTRGEAWVDQPRFNMRVLHGGSYLTNGPKMRVSRRGYDNPGSKATLIGIRCCRTK